MKCITCRDREQYPACEQCLTCYQAMIDAQETARRKDKSTWAAQLAGPAEDYPSREDYAKTVAAERKREDAKADERERGIR